MGKKNQEKLKVLFDEIQRFARTNLHFLPLRPKLIEREEDYFKDDFDYLVKREELPKLFTYIYDHCKNNAIHFLLEQKFSNKRKFIFFINPDGSEKLTLEFWINIELTINNSPKILPADALFEKLKTNKLSEEELLPLIYLTHLFHKKKDVTSLENQYRIREFLKRLDRVPANSLQTKIKAWLEQLQSGSGDLKKLNKAALQELNHLGITSKPNDPLKLRFISARLWQKIFYLHHLAPIMGPDGVGKGSVSEHALAKLPDWKPFRFKDLYRMRIFYKHLVLRFFNSKDEPKNKLDERLGYYIFMVSLFSIRILRLYLRGKEVLLDRYYPDYFATPIRYPKEGETPKKLKGYSLLLFLTPVPQKMVFMGCTDESLIARKNELPLTSVDYLQDLSIEFILKKKIRQVLFIATENPIEHTGEVLYSFLKKD